MVVDNEVGVNLSGHLETCRINKPLIELTVDIKQNSKNPINYE